MKKITLLLLLMPVVAWTQAIKPNLFDVEVGNAYQVVDPRYRYYYSTENQIYMFKIQKTDLIVQYYDMQTHKETKHHVIPRVMEKKEIEQVLELGDKVYFFYSSYDKPNETEQLYGQEFDLSSASLSKPELILSVKGKIQRSESQTGANGSVSMNKFKFNYSFDKSTLLVWYEKYPEIKSDAKNKDVFGLFVFDDELAKKWGKEIKMPYTEKEMDNFDFQVDANENVYLLASVNDNAEILKYNNDEFEELKISSNDKKLFNPAIVEGSDKNLYLTGLYSGSKNINEIEGIFFNVLDQNGNLGDYRYIKIPKSLIVSNVSEREKNKIEKKESKKGSIKLNLEMGRILVNENGDLLLTLEEKFVTIHTVTDSKGRIVRVETTYHLNEEYVIKVNKEGEYLWGFKIPKIQTSRRAYSAIGSKYYYHNNKHYFLFIDHLGNQDLKANDIPKQYIDSNKGLFTAYVIDDETGQAQRDALFDMTQISYKGKTMKVYNFKLDRILETPTGFAVEVYKKGKEDVMIHIDYKQ